MSLKLAAYNPRLVWANADRRAQLFLALLVVALYADVLFAGRGFYLLDIISYHVPMKWIVRDVVLHGEFPLWNRFYSAGQPLAANPAYEVFYPPQWLIWLPSYHFGFQLHILVHFVIAAWGMFALLRALGARALAATFGAAVFVLCGPYLSLATKLPLLFSLSWMPLALHCARKAMLERTPRNVAVAALVLSMQLIIGEPTMAMQTWLLIVAYVVWSAGVSPAGPAPSRRRRRDAAWPAAGTAALLGVLAALLAAIQLVPAIDFTRDSVRSEPFEFRVVSNWSMPLVRPIEMFLPALFRHLPNETGAPAITTMYAFRSDAFVPELYLGLFVALLAVAGILAGARGAGAAVTVVLLSIVAAAGEHTPLLRALYDLHLFRSLRYPEKFILTAAFALIVWAALLFDRLLAGDKRLIRAAIAVASIWMVIMSIAALASGSTRAYFGWQLLRAAVVVTLLALIRRRPIAVVVIALSIADLWLATRSLVPRMPRAYFDPPPLVAQLPPKPARIFPQAYWEAFDRDPNALAWISNRTDDVYWWMFRNSLGDHLPARFGYELAMEDDVDRTALQTTDALLEQMKTRRAQHVIAAEQPFLKTAGVTVRLRYRQAQDGAATDTTPVEPVLESYPRYSFAENGEVRSVQERANSARIAVRATAPAFLFMSVTAHQYWSATLDGKPAPLVPANGAYQGIDVPAGDHVIEMHYRNPMVWVGAAITLTALAALLVVTVSSRASVPARD